MERIAIYGKGGVGKSVVATNLSVHFAMSGKRVLHVGCDPKHDSAIRLLDGTHTVRTVLDVLRDDPHAELTSEIINVGRHGIHACESGGPSPGLGCGGRGVARTIEYLDDTQFLDSGNYEVVIFDVLGDVVCGGFAAPLRAGFAEKVVIVASEEPMAIFAANNIARAVLTYQHNGVVLAGLVANLRGENADVTPIEQFAARLGTRVLAVVERDPLIITAERNQRTILEYAPESPAARAMSQLGCALTEVRAADVPPPVPMPDDGLFEFMRTWGT
jgi:nitrogenase iron protein NifH